MAPLVVLMLLFAFSGHSSGTWCVCKGGEDSILQHTLDYACGNGADCGAIHEKGACYNPNTVRSHCNYAVNSFFQRKAQAPGTCNFSGTAYTSPSDPSTPGCTYLATVSGSTGNTPTQVTTNPGNLPSTTGTTTNPYLTTPSSGGVMGGISTGLGPSGAGADISHDGSKIKVSYFFVILLFSGLML
ncbi:hypothetical protein ACFE04_005780 [Oxalis oulophora]